MYEQRDTSVPRKHHADYRDRGNWDTTKTQNVHIMVYSFNPYCAGINFKRQNLMSADIRFCLKLIPAL